MSRVMTLAAAIVQACPSQWLFCLTTSALLTTPNRRQDVFDKQHFAPSARCALTDTDYLLPLNITAKISRGDGFFPFARTACTAS